MACSFIKKRFSQRCFSMKFARLFRPLILNMIIYVMQYRQKQPPRGVPWERCSENVPQIDRRTPCCSVISIKLQSNFIEIALRHGCSPVNLLHIFRTPFLKNSSGWLLLTFGVIQVSTIARLNIELEARKFDDQTYLMILYLFVSLTSKLQSKVFFAENFYFCRQSQK